MLRVASIVCPSVKAFPWRRKWWARSSVALVGLDPTMNPNPASSRASRFPADNMPASATTITSLTWWRSAKPVRTGTRVLVSALFPSNTCTSSGNPEAVVSRPTVTWGSTRRSLLIPTLRSRSSMSVSKWSVVKSYNTIANPPPSTAWGVAGGRDHRAVVAFDHPFQATHERHPGRSGHTELGQHPHRVGFAGRLDDPGQHQRLERVVEDLTEPQLLIDRLERLPHDQRRGALHEGHPERPATGGGGADRQHVLADGQPGLRRLQQQRELGIVMS